MTKTCKTVETARKSRQSDHRAQKLRDKMEKIFRQTEKGPRDERAGGAADKIETTDVNSDNACAGRNRAQKGEILALTLAQTERKPKKSYA